MTYEKDKFANDFAFTSDTPYGAASEPTFAGALSFMRRQYSRDLSKADVAVLGIPLDTATSNRPGTRFGPQGVRRASTILCEAPHYPFGFDIFKDLAVIDYGDCLFDYGRGQEVPDTIYQTAKKVVDSNTFLYSIGGDHFVTYPLLKAHAEKHGPVALVQFDAHQDTWDDEEDRIDHGTMITRAVKHGLIDVEHSIQIGIRTHASQTYGIEIIDAQEMHKLSDEEIAKRIQDRVAGKNAYLTFDIDCLDPAFAPGTGTPVCGGLTSAKAIDIMCRLKDIPFVGGDIVEVSPPYDHADVTSLAGATIAQCFLGLLAQRKREA